MKKGSTWGDATKKRIKGQNTAVKNAFNENKPIPTPKIKIRRR